MLLYIWIHFNMTNKESASCKSTLYQIIALQGHHNDRGGVSNHWRLDCLFMLLVRRKSQKTSKLRVTGLCEGYPQLIGWFPTQRASSTENVSIWWRHHGIIKHILGLMNAIKTGLYFQNMMVRIIFSSLALIERFVPTSIWGKYLAHQNIMNQSFPKMQPAWSTYRIWYLFKLEAFDTCKVSIHQDSWKFKY